MKSTHTFSISFFLRKDKVKHGKAPLFARVTVDGAFTDISAKHRVDTSSWNQSKQMLSGKGVEEVMVREKMRLLTNDLNNAYNELRHENKIITAESIKARIDGKDKDQCSLNFLFNHHNVDLASLVEPGTLKNYFSTHRFLQEFLIKMRKVKDIYLDDVDNKLITEFGIYMRSRVLRISLQFQNLDTIGHYLPCHNHSDFLKLKSNSKRNDKINDFIFKN